MIPTTASIHSTAPSALLGHFALPCVQNEVMKSYAPNSVEREGLQKAIKEMQSTTYEVPCVVNGEKAWFNESLC